MADSTSFRSNPETFSWPRAYWCGALAALAYESSSPWAGELSTAYGVRSFELSRAGGTLDSGILFAHFDEVSFVAVEGTVSRAQILNYSLLDSWTPGVVTGHRHPRAFYENGRDVAEVVKARVPASTPLVLAGHSLGGASASICAFLLRRAGWNVRAVYTYGSPKPGNYPFRDAYTIPNFRLASPLDPVPLLPPFFDYLTTSDDELTTYRELVDHVGTLIELDNTDPVEAAAEIIREIKVYGLFGLASSVSRHFMGSYMEALYAQLTAEEKSNFGKVLEILTPLGSHGTPSGPIPGTNPEPPADLVAGSIESERSVIRGLIGETGSLRVHLFTAPATLPEDVSGASFREPTYPGYAPKAIPATVPITASGRGPSETEWATLAFAPSEALGLPVEVLGAFVSESAGSGGRRPTAAVLFPLTARLQSPTRPVNVRVRISCAEVLG